MLTLSPLFSNGMVLEKTAVIRGKTEPLTPINFHFLTQHETVTAGANGCFQIPLTAPPYGGPYEMTVGPITFTEVYIGRVWLCGGQSNMETPLSRARILLNEYITNEPRIRMFIQAKSYAFDGAEREAEGRWVSAEDNRANGAVLDDLFAVPYFFAKELRKENDIPIGLVCAAAGGTSAEAWLPEEEANQFPRHREALAKWKDPAEVRRAEEEGAKREAEWNALLNQRDKGITNEWFSRREPERNEPVTPSGISGANSNTVWQKLSNVTGTTGFPAHGAVWLRKKIVLNEQPEGEAILFLGRAVNSVTVYVNGVQAINVGYQYPPCRAILPGRVFQKGENLITVRLVGSADAPRFIPGKPYELTYGHEKISLLRGWEYKTGCEMPEHTPSFWFYEVPTAVYRTMLAPVLDYTYEGVIWYQGESNIHHPQDYAEIFTAFAKHLRRRNGANLPIIFTQLARYDDPEDVGNKRFEALREQQRQCLAIPHTAMIDAYDCGERNDLHPLDKRTVGIRLAQAAQNLTRCFFAPGRVNLIGEHTDYNGGSVFPCALSLGIRAEVRKRDDGVLKLSSESFPGVVYAELAHLAYAEAHGWANYPKAVAYEIQRAGYSFGGADIHFSSTLPGNAGLSSSACIEILTCVILDALYNLNIPPVERVKICQKAENEFVGVNCGIMDQFACGMGKDGHAILLNCQTLDYEYVPLALGDYRIVIVNTNKKRGLADSKYNERRAECEEALRMLRTVKPWQNLCAITPQEFAEHARVITNETLRKRAEHAVNENARVLQSANALPAGALKEFGRLMNESHVSLRDLYEVTGAELDALAEASWQVEGVLGARMTGAGFGGCAVSLVHKDAIENYTKQVGAAYTAKTGLTADFYTAQIGGGPGEIGPIAFMNK